MSTTAIARQAVSAQANKYLIIVLGGEAYGIAVLKVREIIRLQKITPVPQLPDFVKGVLNLRGMAKVKGQVKTLLDIDRVVALETLQAVVAAV